MKTKPFFPFKFNKKKKKNINYSSFYYGSIGIYNIESGSINKNQLRALRQAITKVLKRRGFMWFKVYPEIPLTSKPQSSRMGKGKGGIDTWVCNISPGTIFIEIQSFTKKIGTLSILSCIKRLPFRCGLVFSSTYETQFK